jgi:D-alanyl-D-alanine carboxypeptidase (penicillin-binding protein 5/6)
MKLKKLCVFVALLLIFPLTASAAEESAAIYPYEFAWEECWYEEAEEAAALTADFKAKSAFLMDAATGKVLFSMNEDEKVPISSLTKIMSELLIAEAITNGKIKKTDMVPVSEHAASMGGAQVYLKANEQISVNELLKAMCVSAANDATVALAEYVSGSEESFVAAMNDRAKKLGMNNTLFKNASGLHEKDHYSSARDVALMTQELLKYPMILEYTTIWMDTIRRGTFGLANTNKLIKFYSGANGMSAGFSDEAKYCLCGTAKRNGFQLIAVVLGAESNDERLSAVKKMLDYGFANYSIVRPEKLYLEQVTILGGVKESAEIDYTPPSLLLEKGKGGKITQKAHIEETPEAPVRKGDTVGYVVYEVDGAEAARVPVFITEDVGKINYLIVLGRMIKSMFSFF